MAGAGRWRALEVDAAVDEEVHARDGQLALVCELVPNGDARHVPVRSRRPQVRQLAVGRHVRLVLECGQVHACSSSFVCSECA